MRGAHARARAGWLRSGTAIVGELATLALVVLLTNVATRFVSVYWAAIDCATDPARQWLIAGCTLVPAVLRHRLPTAALLMAAALFGWYPAAAAAFALTAYSSAFRISSGRRLAVVTGLAAVIPLAVASIGSAFQWQSVITAYGFGVVVCLMVPTMLGLLIGQRERLLLALRQQTGYLRRNYELADSAARLQERSRIAGEMHDLLGHRLSLISLYAGALELDAASSAGRADEAKLIRGTVVGAMDELRRILGVLREAGNDTSAVLPAETAGTRSDIADLVAQSRTAGVPVHLSWAGDDLRDAAPATRRAVHRIVREALTNVHRHAAGASATVVVRRDAERVRVEVDNGPGRPGVGAAQPPGTGSGLVGVQERVRLLGGALWTGRAADGGFRLAANLPVRPALDGAVNDEAAEAHAAPEPASGPAARTVDPAGAGAPVPARRFGSADRWARAGMSAVLSTGLAGTIAIVNLAFGYVSFQPASANLDPTAVIRVGTPRQEVVDLIGDDDPILRLAARPGQPPVPPGAQCMYQLAPVALDEQVGPGGPGDIDSEPPLGAPRVWTVRRHCFSQERLVQILDFPLTDPGDRPGE